jgi:hypothetical protein
MCVVGERIGFTLVEILYWRIRAAKSLPPEKSRQEGTLTLKTVVKVVDIGDVRVKIMSDASGPIDLMMDGASRAGRLRHSLNKLSLSSSLQDRQLP